MTTTTRVNGWTLPTLGDSTPTVDDMMGFAVEADKLLVGTAATFADIYTLHLSLPDDQLYYCTELDTIMNVGGLTNRTQSVFPRRQILTGDATITTSQSMLFNIPLAQTGTTGINSAVLVRGQIAYSGNINLTLEWQNQSNAEPIPASVISYWSVNPTTTTAKVFYISGTPQDNSITISTSSSESIITFQLRLIPDDTEDSVDLYLNTASSTVTVNSYGTYCDTWYSVP